MLFLDLGGVFCCLLDVRLKRLQSSLCLLPLVRKTQCVRSTKVVWTPVSLESQWQT